MAGHGGGLLALECGGDDFDAGGGGGGAQHVAGAIVAAAVVVGCGWLDGVYGGDRRVGLLPCAGTPGFPTSLTGALTLTPTLAGGWMAHDRLFGGGALL